MRRVLPPLLLAVVALSGCGPTDEGDAGPTRAPSPSTSAPAGRDAVCEQVRAGIDAFNAGDFETTVERFKDAVPLARKAQASDSSREAALLLRAVRYYAALPAPTYPEASTSSPEFQRWKAVTLTLCASGQDQLSPGPDPEDSAIPA